MTPIRKMLRSILAMRDSTEQWMKQRKALQTMEEKMMMKELILAIEQDLLELKAGFLMEEIIISKDLKVVGDGMMARASMSGKLIMRRENPTGRTALRRRRRGAVKRRKIELQTAESGESRGLWYSVMGATGAAGVGPGGSSGKSVRNNSNSNSNRNSNRRRRSSSSSKGRRLPSQLSRSSGDLRRARRRPLKPPRRQAQRVTR